MQRLKNTQKISFLVVLFLVLILVFLILKPFINIMALALIIAILFNPVFRFFDRRTGNRSIAAGLTIALVFLIIALPVWLFGQILVTELLSLYDRVKQGGLLIDRSQIIDNVPVQLQGLIEGISEDVGSFLRNFTANAFETFSNLLSNLASFFIAFFLLFFLLYYVLRDGHTIKTMLMDISPIETNQENKLFSRIVAAVNGVVKGQFLIALVQGCVATLGFIIFGIPEPVLWGLFTVLTALVPTVGTSLSLIPAIIYLAITGQAPQAIGLTIWGVVAVGLIDNVIGPKLIGSTTKLHPILVLLSVLGGIQFFGFLGFLIGPILMAIFVALIDLYRTDFKDYIH